MKMQNFSYKHEVQDFSRRKDGKWEVKIKDLKTNKVEHHITDYLFIGAGGGCNSNATKNWYSRK